MKIIRSQNNKILINASEITHFEITAKRKNPTSNPWENIFLENNSSIPEEEKVYAITTPTEIARYSTEDQALNALNQLERFLCNDNATLFTMPLDGGLHYA